MDVCIDACCVKQLSQPIRACVYIYVCMLCRTAITAHKSVCTYACMLWCAGMTSSLYERVCILFNLEAMQSQIVETLNLTRDEGLKLAAKLFQVSYSR